MSANYADHGFARIVRGPDMAVGLRKINADVKLHHLACCERFFSANLGRASGTHLAACHINHTSAITKRL